jgi:hypothetical protein
MDLKPGVDNSAVAWKIGVDKVTGGKAEMAGKAMLGPHI